MQRPLLKRLAIRLLAIRSINRITVAMVRRLPRRTWRARIPVMDIVGRLDLGEGREITMARPDKCALAREIYWNDGGLETAADKRALRLAIDLSDRPGIFLDIGSYTGLFALSVARCRPQIVSHAYEIIPENFLLLWENTIENDLVCNVQPHLTGVAAESSVLRMPIGFGPGVLASSADLGTSNSSEFAGGNPGVKVPVEPLDSLFNSFEGGLVMKIDVEGYEWQVLKGGEDLISRLKPDIVCEILRRAPDILALEGFLEKHGYSAFRITGQGLVGPTKIVAVKTERDWLFTTRTAAELQTKGHPVLPV
jgi:FkbM family methyltransferase